MWVTALITPRTALIPIVIATSILFLALLGGFGAHAGGAPVTTAAIRVTFWGALAMALTGGGRCAVRIGGVTQL